MKIANLEFDRQLFHFAYILKTHSKNTECVRRIMYTAAENKEYDQKS